MYQDKQVAEYQERRNEVKIIEQQDEQSSSKKSSKSKEKPNNIFWDSLDQANWISNSKASHCFYCYAEFKLLRRRHHCRKCGKVFCSSHVHNKSVAGITEKICVDCEKDYDQYIKNKQQTPYLSESNCQSLANSDVNGNMEKREPLPQDYDQLNQSSRILSDYNRESIKQTFFDADNDQNYMENQFMSGELQRNRRISDGKTNHPSSKLFTSMVSNQEQQQTSVSYMDRTFQTEKRVQNYLNNLQNEQSSPVQQNSTSVGRLQEFSKRHISKVVSEQLFIHDLNIQKWHNLLTKFVMKAVEQVRPSSRMLGDSMDINECIKIKIIDWKDNSRSSYINGIVTSKSIINNRMAKVIDDPRILLLKESLGQDEVSDLASTLDVEGHIMKILEQKLDQINPNLVIIEKDISMKLVRLLKDKGITVVTNLEENKLKRLARLTQTMLLPSMNVIDRSFVLGKCKRFREENLTKLMREENISGTSMFQHSHESESTVLVFDGCNPALGCTICLSGPLATEKQELQTVKSALKKILTLARNIVLERAFLIQIQCEVPVPPPEEGVENEQGSAVEPTSITQVDEEIEMEFDEKPNEKQQPHYQVVKDDQINDGKTLDEILLKWQKTDEVTPFLITKYIENRSILVLQKTVISLKQVGPQQKSNTSIYPNQLSPISHNDEFQGVESFINAVGLSERHDTIVSDTQSIGTQVSKVTGQDKKQNEKQIQKQLDKCCGTPKKSMIQFNRQAAKEEDKPDMNDMTLGKYLERMVTNLKDKCNSCGLERFHHSIEMYHKDGQLQVTIVPQQQHFDDRNSRKQSVSGQPMFQSKNLEKKIGHKSDLHTSNHDNSNANKAINTEKIQIYCQCMVCNRFCSRQLVSSNLYEYSRARFFEQFFYNNKLKVKSGLFSCDHGEHPLRNFAIIFEVSQCKIIFRYSPVDVYSIQIVNPKKFSSEDSLVRLVVDKKNKLQDALEMALENFKLDQVQVLTKRIDFAISTWDLRNECYSKSNIPMLVAHLEKVKTVLENLQNGFKKFQTEASQELVKFRTEILELMFLRKKACITFLGYQRAIDENIKIIALLLIISWRRVQVIDRRLLESRTIVSPFKNSILGPAISEQLEAESSTSIKVDQSQNLTNLLSKQPILTDLGNPQSMVKVTEIIGEEEEDRQSASMISRPTVSKVSSDDDSDTSIHRLRESETSHLETQLKKSRSSSHAMKQSSNSFANRESIARVEDLDGSIDQAPQSLMESNLARLKTQSMEKRGSVKNDKNQVSLKVSQKDPLNRTDNMIGINGNKFDDSTNLGRQMTANCFIEDLCNCEEDIPETSPSNEVKKKQNHVISSSAQVTNIAALLQQSTMAGQGIPTPKGTKIGSTAKEPNNQKPPNPTAQLIESAPADISHLQNALSNTMKSYGYTGDKSVMPPSPSNTNQGGPNLGAPSQKMSYFRKPRMQNTLCRMALNSSANPNCANPAHVTVCYNRMVDEVQNLINELHREVYSKEKPQMIYDNLREETSFEETQEGGISAFQLGEEPNSKHASEKTELQMPKIKLLDQSDSPSGLERNTQHRMAQNLHETQQFINDLSLIQPAPGKERSASKDSRGQEAQKQKNDLSQALSSPSVPHKWRKLEWIKKMSNNCIFMPYGVDNVYTQINPKDYGSIIAYALTSNAYIEGLIKLNYMELNAIVKKHQLDSHDQQTHVNQLSGQQIMPMQIHLLDKEDVLNHDPIDKQRIEAELLSSNKISFTFKFSTHGKDVCIKIVDGRQWYEFNHSTMHFKTGVTRHKNKDGIVKKDIETKLAEKHTVGPKKEIIPKKRKMNDMQNHVLSQYPKDYLKNENVRDAITELEKIHYGLSNHYFFKERLEEVDNFMKGKKNHHLAHQNTMGTNFTSSDGGNLANKIKANGLLPSVEEHTPTVENMSTHQRSVCDFDIIERVEPDLDQSAMGLTADQEDNSFFQIQSKNSFVPQDPNDTANFEKISVKPQDLSKRKMKKFVKAQSQMFKEQEKLKGKDNHGQSALKIEQGTVFDIQSPAKQLVKEQGKAITTFNEELHIPKIDFEVKVYFPKRFSALRRFYCGTHIEYIKSICKTQAWSASGGKSSATFRKSHDEKYVFKVVKESEFKMFVEFGPNYFDYMTKSFFHNYPCALIKILGAYVVKIKCDENEELDSKKYIFVYENLNQGITPEDEQNIVRFDLKGSEINRLSNIPMGENGPEKVVMMDSNFLLQLNGRPLALRITHANLLSICVGNDTLCLSKQNIIDYSLLAVIDTVRKKIRFGILDYCQMYTFDKKVETQLKTIVNFGGLPTIIPPDPYKIRFQQFVRNYFLGICIQKEKKLGRGVTSNQLRKSIREERKEQDKYVNEDDKLGKSLREDQLERIKPSEDSKVPK